VASHLSQQAGVQILLLCLAALGMGIQGALVWAFMIPGVVADTLTATLITLGQRLAQGLGHRGPESQERGWSTMNMVLLCLIYVASAVVVALTSAFILTPLVPVIIVTIAICALLVPGLFQPARPREAFQPHPPRAQREEVREGGQGWCKIVLAACGESRRSCSGGVTHRLKAMGSDGK
jgi:uncharacterized membrane protein YoaK (UPF0700 family)